MEGEPTKEAKGNGKKVRRRTRPSFPKKEEMIVSLMEKLGLEESQLYEKYDEFKSKYPTGKTSYRSQNEPSYQKLSKAEYQHFNVQAE